VQVTIQITAARATALSDRDHSCLRDHLEGSSLLIVDIGWAIVHHPVRLRLQVATPRGIATVAASDIM
jgi:hypothetical protein